MFLEGVVASLHAGVGRYPEALEYLSSRLVTAQEIEEFRIGFGRVVHVPEEASAERKRFMDETWRGRKLESRIVFPFLDAIGRVVGLAGRAIGGKEFKTFVTEEAKFAGFFFGLFQALPHIYRENRAYVVEGYFDLLAFRKVFPNVVATATAGMNEAQHAQLSMYCDRIVTCFDSDMPGRRGAEKADRLGPNVWSMTIGCGVGMGYKDPAECLEKLGRDRFERFMREKAAMLPPF